MINKNKGNDGDFEDDFETEDFSEAEYDESFDEAEAVDADEYADEDFENEDWQDDVAAPVKKGRKDSGDKKGTSFNTIVIIGAVVLGGGVLAFNVMKETTKAESAQSSVFQSILNLGDIMDGTLFGGDEQKSGDGPGQSAPTDQAQTESFLDNPESLNTPTTPPQPVPIASPDTAVVPTEPLTPMPTEPSDLTPRGPDEIVAATTEEKIISPVIPEPEVPATPPAADTKPTAQDILKQAMANREQKAEENREAVKQPAPELPVVVVAEKPPVITPAPVVPVTPPFAVITKPPVPSADPKVVAANTQAVQNLEGRIDTLLKRMDQIESELGTVRESKQTDIKAIEKTVQSLKSDLTQLKDRPAPAALAVKTATKADVSEDREEPVKTKPVPVRKKKAKKPAPAVSENMDGVYSPSTSYAAPTVAAAPKPAVSSKAWELRAAQPGRAWVSKPGARDMQGVTVGQDLAGIGRITAITYQNNQWVIQGTKGQIQQ